MTSTRALTNGHGHEVVRPAGPAGPVGWIAPGAARDLHRARGGGVPARRPAGRPAASAPTPGRPGGTTPLPRREPSGPIERQSMEAAREMPRPRAAEAARGPWAHRRRVHRICLLPQLCRRSPAFPSRNGNSDLGRAPARPSDSRVGPGQQGLRAGASRALGSQQGMGGRLPDRARACPGDRVSSPWPGQQAMQPGQSGPTRPRRRACPGQQSLARVRACLGNQQGIPGQQGMGNQPGMAGGQQSMAGQSLPGQGSPTSPPARCRAQTPPAQGQPGQSMPGQNVQCQQGIQAIPGHLRPAGYGRPAGHVLAAAAKPAAGSADAVPGQHAAPSAPPPSSPPGLPDPRVRGAHAQTSPSADQNPYQAPPASFRGPAQDVPSRPYQQGSYGAPPSEQMMPGQPYPLARAPGARPDRGSSPGFVPTSRRKEPLRHTASRPLPQTPVRADPRRRRPSVPPADTACAAARPRCRSRRRRSPRGPASPRAAKRHGPAGPGDATIADAVQAAHAEGFEFGQSVAREAPALWLEAVLARKPRMPSDLEARLLQDSALPIDSLLHDETRHALRRGFWDALERSRR